MGSLTGVPIARGRIRFNHLFFADDILVFCKVSLLEWSYLQHILDRYQKVSGQRLNKEKTSIFFSPNTKAEITSQIFFLFLGSRLLNALKNIWVCRQWWELLWLLKIVSGLG